MTWTCGMTATSKNQSRDFPCGLTQKLQCATWDGTNNSSKRKRRKSVEK